MQELWQKTAFELASDIRSGRVSSVEVTNDILERMTAVNTTINAVVDTMQEEALASAREADNELRKSGPRGPLHGIPVTVKINVDYSGRATTNGVVAYKDLLANDDGSVVRNLKNSGAVIFGRTNTPCFSMRLFTSNDLHGATLNPHDATITPGGSSGGAASATSAGIGAIAHGNDIGGSVRYPAYACGVYGFRPTSGVVPNHNSSQFAERMIVSQMSSVQGPLARSVEDLRLAMVAMSAPDPRDIWQVPTHGMFDPLEIEPCRVAMLSDTNDSDVDPEVSSAIRLAGDMLRDAGYSVVEAEIPSMLDASRFWKTALVNEMLSGSMPKILELGDGKIKRSVERFTDGLNVLESRDDFLQTFALRSKMLREWQIFLSEFPLILTASSWVKPIIDDYDVSADLDMDWFGRVTAPMHATPILGLPGLAVPVGTVIGKPMGIQMIANRFEDRRLLSAGKALEKALGPLLPIDPQPGAERSSE